mmetsp:Transcript_56820/g.144021  ORF Transcript_56820/g.144021 Transcript_56820/m.144021 type:complete len:164 (-) Transcript_56820:136-627(-)
MDSPCRFSSLDGIKRHWPSSLPAVEPTSWDSPSRNQGIGDLVLGSASAGEVSPMLAPALAELRKDGPVEFKRILMPAPLAGGKLGLGFTDLEVVSIMDPAAAAYGWSVGDRVQSINGVPLTSQGEFTRALQLAMDEYWSRGNPLTFDIQRGSRRATRRSGCVC